MRHLPFTALELRFSLSGRTRRVMTDVLQQEVDKLNAHHMLASPCHSLADAIRTSLLFIHDPCQNQCS